jgi:tripartite-type tricarboxylate transporter receptor subunit TctC
VQAGKLRALAVTGPRRSPLMPDADDGRSGSAQLRVRDVVYRQRAGWHAQGCAGRLNQTLNAALAQPELKARLIKEGFEPLTMSPAQADAMLRKEMVRWAAQIKQAGITPE